MTWKKVKAGEYVSGKFVVVRDTWTVEETGDPDDDCAVTEWFLYQDGDMVDGYPTARRAKEAAENLA